MELDHHVSRVRRLLGLWHHIRGYEVIKHIGGSQLLSSIVTPALRLSTGSNLIRRWCLLRHRVLGFTRKTSGPGCSWDVDQPHWIYNTSTHGPGDIGRHHDRVGRTSRWHVRRQNFTPLDVTPVAKATGDEVDGYSSAAGDKEYKRYSSGKVCSRLEKGKQIAVVTGSDSHW